mgnify:CR=1 FL=1
MKEAIKLVEKALEILKRREKGKGCFEFLETWRNIHDWKT